MSLTFTILDDTYSANDSTGRKRIFGTVSLTNPYTANGESFTVSTWFKTKFLGGHVTQVAAAVTTANAGIARTGTFRSDTNSVSAAVLFQMFQGGLTTLSGTWIDNTTANLSNTTFTLELFGY